MKVDTLEGVSFLYVRENQKIKIAKKVIKKGWNRYQALPYVLLPTTRLENGYTNAAEVMRNTIKNWIKIYDSCDINKLQWSSDA